MDGGPFPLLICIEAALERPFGSVLVSPTGSFPSQGCEDPRVAWRNNRMFLARLATRHG
ncbi:hypothetical protein SAMN02745206_02618 [Desulfacinum infernum DSM 9756]|jgi:hypothetical protein|uniref:Uncharacterized protein n=1 Tax=Desulfacinum infernum DSM 9756 TaxID=1121391 RepID=A0A1M5EAW8_9BACT|nr:hypothetical protein SAMN02745206_02618 [Desulfacinum infernum DSM 9756]